MGVIRADDDDVIACGWHSGAPVAKDRAHRGSGYRHDLPTAGHFWHDATIMTELLSSLQGQSSQEDPGISRVEIALRAIPEGTELTVTRHDAFQSVDVHADVSVRKYQ
jgi:hypothetical protein